MKHIKTFAALNEAKKDEKDEKKASKKELMDRLEKKFKVSKDKSGDTIIDIKSGQDFPYKISEKGNQFILSQQWSARSYLTPKWQRVKACDSFETALETIIKRYNKSCSYMNTKPI